MKKTRLMTVGILGMLLGEFVASTFLNVPIEIPLIIYVALFAFVVGLYLTGASNEGTI
jgi:hypothetical protein